jgi:hypothetical protein
MNAFSKRTASKECLELRKKFQRVDELEVDLVAEPKTHNKILNFLHIPKSGGELIGKIMSRPHSHFKRFGLLHGSCRSKKFNDHCAVNPGCNCSHWHIPPRYLSPNQYGNSDVFCSLSSELSLNLKWTSWTNYWRKRRT